MENSTNNIHVENQDDASENRWIKVVTGHHKGPRRKVFHPASKQIEIAYRLSLLMASIIGQHRKNATLNRFITNVRKKLTN
jgi:hypothetical protein